jgi:hypothetical protein
MIVNILWKVNVYRGVTGFFHVWHLFLLTFDAVKLRMNTQLANKDDSWHYIEHVQTRICFDSDRNQRISVIKTLIIMSIIHFPSHLAAKFVFIILRGHGSTSDICHRSCWSLHLRHQHREWFGYWGYHISSYDAWYIKPEDAVDHCESWWMITNDLRSGKWWQER